jgi:translation initiation factor 2B subunit (eIF-2B alpha/beta/delta family)
MPIEADKLEKLKKAENLGAGLAALRHNEAFILIEETLKKEAERAHSDLLTAPREDVETYRQKEISFTLATKLIDKLIRIGDKAREMIAKLEEE